MEFTCSVCEHKYDENTGDADERMCHECMEKEDYSERTGIDVLCDGLTAIGLSKSQQSQIMKLVRQYIRS